MRSWKTTATGIGAALVAIVNAIIGTINGTPVDWSLTISLIITAIGLIAAKDSNVTGTGAPK